MGKKYTETSIKTLSAREHVRLRVGNYTGGNFDPTHLIKEIYYNAQDEHEIGNGNKIIITYDTKINEISVEDFGQGFPVGITRQEDNKTILQAAADTLNTSGKFSGEVYNNNVTGLNGQGLKITNFLSEYLIISSCDGSGKQETVVFKEGVFDTRIYKNIDTTIHGTKVTWKPDAKFFQNINCNIEELKQLFKECAALHPKLTIEFNLDNETIIYHSENGLIDLLNAAVKDEILTNRFIVSKSASKDSGSDRLDIALTYTNEYSERIIPYVNAALTESGVHIAAVKAGITRQINRYALENNYIKNTEQQFTQSELGEGLIIIFNLKAGGVDYTGQSKEKVSNIDKTLINQVINNDFYDWLNNNPKDSKIIIDKAILARKAKNAAQKAKDGIRNAGVKGKKFISLPTKLVDAYSKNRSETELFICEGDSAAANLIAKRDGKTQAIFPVRGKVLSCRKATIDKIYANQEISNIVKALGLDVDKTTGKLIYNSKKLRYGKIILACDGDIDGKNIVSLLLNMFWEICKELVINGHIYVALPPLFKITTLKNEYIFLRDEKALNIYKKDHVKEKYLVQRSKGLGEMDANEIKYCLLNINSRNVQQIVVENENIADNMLECFFGNDVSDRRKYLLDHQTEVGKELKIY